MISSLNFGMFKMKIKKEHDNELINDNLHLKNTELKEGKNKVIVDTAILGNFLVNSIDKIVEGKVTIGEIETMVCLNDYWINNSQVRHSSKEEAVIYHDKLVKRLIEKPLETILSLKCNNEAISSLYESNKEIRKLWK